MLTLDASDFLPLTNEQFIIPLSTPLNQDVCFDLSINGDVIREADEAFTVTITVGNSNDVIVGPNTVTVTILDDNDGMKNMLPFCTAVTYIYSDSLTITTFSLLWITTYNIVMYALPGTCTLCQLAWV